MNILFIGAGKMATALAGGIAIGVYFNVNSGLLQFGIGHLRGNGALPN